MKTIKFTINGNHKNKLGNAIPYHRTTQRSLWNKTSRRYYEWKEYVRARAFEAGVHSLIEGTPKGKVRVQIAFRNENHADPDNIIKGILDSLFVNDKHIDVETTHICKQNQPKVIVTIHL